MERPSRLTVWRSRLVVWSAAAAVGAALAARLLADGAAQSLPFVQDWTNVDLISVNDNWNTVPGIVGYRGDNLTSLVGADPQTIVGDVAPVVDVNANLPNPSLFGTGGVAEFHLANPTVALSGSSTADAPFLLISISTLGESAVGVRYNVRDVDGAPDEAVQSVALQYRVGNTGNFINVPEAFVQDATEGPNLARMVTPVSVVLPAAALNQPLVQLRIITANADGDGGRDEWVGIDDIVISSTTPPTATASAEPTSVTPGSALLLTARVSPGQNPVSTGLAVIADLSSIGGSSAASLYDDGTHGDVTPGDLLYSLGATVAPGTQPGSKLLSLTISDGGSRTTTTKIALAVPVPAGTLLWQDWSNVNLITANGIWSGVPGIVGYRGDDLTTIIGADPQTILADSTSNPATIDVTANLVNPSTFTSGGVAEFQNPDNPTAALNGSGTADAPFLLLTVNTEGKSGVRVGYTLRDLDLSVDNATSPVALQYRIGTSGTFTNVPEAFVADASAGPVLLRATPVDVMLPPAVDDQPIVQLRIMTANAANDDEWVGVDDILVYATVLPTNPVVTTVSAVPSALEGGDPVLLTTAVQPGEHPTSSGLAVNVNLSAIGASASQQLFDDGSHGDLVTGDLVFSVQAVVGVNSGPGNVALPLAVADAQGRSASGSISVTIQPPPPLTPIHVIQGDGPTSPLAGQVVTTGGIVTALVPSGFYLQTADGEDDGNPATSEGIFVSASGASSAWVAQRVRVTATVDEVVPVPEIAGRPRTQLMAQKIVVLASGQPLPVPRSLSAADLPSSAGVDALERLEGMRVAIPLLTVAGPTGGAVVEADAAAVSNGAFYGVLPGVARPFRERGIKTGSPAPPEAIAPASIPRFDGNPERLRIDTLGQVGSTVPVEVAAGAGVSNIVGVLEHRVGAYTVLTDPTSVPSALGGKTALPVSVRDTSEFTVASLNLERFFDIVDDPLAADAVLSAEAFDRRLSKAARVVFDVLRAPDVIGVQEIENLPTLQAIADAVNTAAASAGRSDVHYNAFLHEGPDLAGLDVGLLVNAPRVQVIEVRQLGAGTSYVDPASGGSAVLFEQPPLVMQARIVAPPYAPYAVTVVVNHLRSLAGIDGASGLQVRTKRRAQAEFVATQIQSRQAANPAERIIVLGGFNASELSDGLVDVVGTIRGLPAPATEVAQGSADLVNPNLVNLTNLAAAGERYSFVFQGNAQALDHLLVTPNTSGRLEHARIGADFPESLRNDASRPERLTNHDAPVGFFSLPVLDTTPPVITVPSNLIVEATGTLTVVSFVVTATDTIDGPVAASCVPLSKSSFPIGITEVTCTARDSRGNLATARFNVTVVDTTPPSVERLTANPGLLWPPNGQPRPVSLIVSAWDLGRAASCRVSSVASNAPAAPTRAGKPSPDWTIAGALTVWLRAEHQPGPIGRVYTIAVTCSDGRGNSTVKTAQVVVPSNMGWLGDRIWRAILYAQQQKKNVKHTVKQQHKPHGKQQDVKRR